MEYQSGLRSQRSPIDHLIRLETFIREASIKKEHLVAVFFALEKAYDTTWKYGIVKDLKNLELEGRMTIFIQIFLQDRRFRVRMGEVFSEEKQEMGVPQGSVLTVTLFNIKIKNIVKNINSGTNCGLYVDDFLICYSARNRNHIERQHQVCLDKLHKGTKENRLKFSKEKTKCVHFCNQRKTQYWKLTTPEYQLLNTKNTLESFLTANFPSFHILNTSEQNATKPYNYLEL